MLRTNGDKEAGMTPTTPSVRAIVARYAEATADNRVFFHPDIPEHRLASALATYPGIEPDDVLVLLDNTESGDGTEGLLLTDAAIHACGSSGLVQRLPFEKLRDVALATASPPVLRLNGIAVLDSIRVRPETMEQFVAMLNEVAGNSDDAATTPSESRPEGNGVASEETAAPTKGIALWNPEAAAMLSVVFSPVFGACIHALNWKTLGNQRLFKASLLWTLPGIVLPFVAGALLPLWLASSIGVAYLGAWYLFAAIGQVRHVRNSLNGAYARRGWLPPIICALVALTLVLFAVGSMAEFRNAGTGRSNWHAPSVEDNLERQAAGMVTEIVADSGSYAYGTAPHCIRVKITEEVVDGFYRGTATLSTGRDLPVTIELKGDTIHVRTEF
jgi:hypothetical protein